MQFFSIELPDCCAILTIVVTRCYEKDMYFFDIAAAPAAYGIGVEVFGM